MTLGSLVFSNVSVNYDASRSSRSRLLREVNTLNASLSEISFALEPGHRLGVFGSNGAGKTTLLRTAAGIYPPTSGSVDISGRVVSFIDLTLGMNPDATPMENIKTRFVLSGFGTREARMRFDRIIAFAGLEKFAKKPLRTFSTGMVMRLAFATATEIPGDIFLMDEWLSVGDEQFKYKAETRLKELIDESKILVLASHSKSLLSQNCNLFLHLEEGKISALGSDPGILNRHF